jgi:cell division protein FtsI/penicillin-binding protein 2
MKRELFSSRIRTISIFVLFISFVLVGRLYFLQIVSGGIYQDKADRQYMQSTYDYFDRGSIYFKTKDGDSFSAASLKVGFMVSIKPKLIKDIDLTYNSLNQIIPLDKTEFYSKASVKTDPYEEIAHKISSDKADQITALKLAGVNVYKERWRFYPANSLASHTIGFIGYKGNEIAGRYGLERYYEDTLKRNNDSAYVNFFAEIFSNIQQSLSGDKKLEGDVITSIEPSVEANLEQTLKKINETWSSQFTGGIIMNPMNGEIIAMAVNPTFDSNNLQNEKNSDIFSNRLVEGVYEMGSIIKPLTMAAGLDTGAVAPETTYFDAGSVTLNKSTFSNFDGKGRGVVNMQVVLNHSLNTGAAFVVQKMGKDNFAKYFRNYGLGEETGIDLPNETHGLIDNLSSPRDIEYATASFGQGIALTPLETIRALASLGNGGKLINPHIGNKIQYKIGGFKTISPGVDKQILKPETSETITRMLVNVVDKALLNGEVKMEHYSIAAKTGTAQIHNPAGGYYPDRYLHSFFGYFPAFEPKFIIFLFTYYPKNIDYASHTLTMPFMDITKFLINYYQIPPDR